MRSGSRASKPASPAIPHISSLSQVILSKRGIRLGVYRLDQYPPAWFRREHIDYRLLRMGTPASPHQIAAFEGITRGMQLSGGVFRTSLPGRFRDLDGSLNSMLTGHFAGISELEAQDWAAADCVTSAEWYESFRSAFA